MEEKRYPFVSIKDKKMIGQGKHGKVYQLNDEQIIKVFYDKSSLPIIEKERNYSKKAFVLGVPTAITFGVVETEVGYGVIFESAGVMPLGTYIETHPKELQEYSEKFADILINLNNLEADTTVYNSVHKWYIDELKKIDPRYLRPQHVEVLIEIIKAIPEKTNFIHTDFHPQNVMVNERGELLLIDMADLGYGNSIFDIGGSYMTMNYLAKSNKKNCYAVTGLSPENCLQVWDILLSRYYNISDKEALRRREKICGFLSDIRMAIMLASSVEMKAYEKYIIAFLERWKVINNVNRYVEAFEKMH